MPKSGPGWRVQFRRKRGGRTDYRQRTRLLRSRIPRLVARPSLKHMVAQVSRATSKGDLTVASAHSEELLGLGWKAYTGNLPAAYLTGLLCGYRAKKAGVDKCVLDLGTYNPTPKSRIFAALKGALDAGLNIPHGEGVLPPDERVSGKHIAQYAEKIKSDEKVYRARFSGYVKRELPPEQLPEHFNQIKRAIIKQYEGRA